MQKLIAYFISIRKLFLHFIRVKGKHYIKISNTSNFISNQLIWNLWSKLLWKSWNQINFPSHGGYIWWQSYFNGACARFIRNTQTIFTPPWISPKFQALERSNQVHMKSKTWIYLPTKYFERPLYTFLSKSMKLH